MFNINLILPFGDPDVIFARLVAVLVLFALLLSSISGWLLVSAIIGWLLGRHEEVLRGRPKRASQDGSSHARYIADPIRRPYGTTSPTALRSSDDRHRTRKRTE